MLHLAVVRSPVAHARITDRRRRGPRLPGVLGGLHRRDLGGGGDLPNAWPITPDQKAPQAPPLAVDTVHFAGDGVAVVIARDAATARDASEPVLVDYDDLPPVLDMEAAVAEGATLLHPDLGTNASAHWVFDSERPAPAAVRRRRSPRRRTIPTRSWSAAGSASSGSSRRSWSRAPWSSTRPASSYHVVGDADPAHPQDARRRH